MSTKTKRKVAKLPKGLPKLPKPQDGFDTWEYMGRGNEFNWPDGPGFTGAVLHYGSKNWTPDTGLCGLAENAHYIRAIKHPAPKVAKKAAVKAVRMWANFDIHSYPAISPNKQSTHPARACIIDVSDEAAMIEQGVSVITQDMGLNEVVRAVLESIGIIAKRKAKK